MKHNNILIIKTSALGDIILALPFQVMRETTERPEAVAAGTVRLVGTNRERIVAETIRLLDSALEYQQMSQAHNPYGDGTAAAKIVTLLAERQNV